jgi:hypothetical protein
MSTEFTPATERVRDRYIENVRDYRATLTVEEAGAEFDRWFSEALSVAWNNGARIGYNYGRDDEHYGIPYTLPINDPYKENR